MPYPDISKKIDFGFGTRIYDKPFSMNKIEKQQGKKYSLKEIKSIFKLEMIGMPTKKINGNTYLIKFEPNINTQEQDIILSKINTNKFNKGYGQPDNSQKWEDASVSYERGEIQQVFGSYEPGTEYYQLRTVRHVTLTNSEGYHKFVYYPNGVSYYHLQSFGSGQRPSELITTVTSNFKKMNSLIKQGAKIYSEWWTC